jgi:Adenosine deaminase
MRAKITLIILAALVLSSMMFASVNLAATSSPTPLSPGISSSAIQLEPVAAQQYWGSVNSNKFHYPWCRWAKAIYPENLVVFKSRQAAMNAGYVPCKVCRP